MTLHMILGRDDVLLPWAADRLGVDDFGQATAIGVHDGAELLAAVVYSNYRPGVDIELSIASTSPHWCSRRSLAAFFAYPFTQLGLPRVSTAASRKNKRARKLNERLGFKLEGIKDRGWDGRVDACYYGMVRDRCRWLRDQMAIAA